MGTFGQGEKGLTASGKTVTRPIFASRSGVGPVVGSSGQPVAAVSEPEGIAGAPGGSGGVAPLISRSNELLGQILGVLQRGPVAVLG